MVFPLGRTTRFTKWVCSPLLSISRIPCSRYRHDLTELEEKFRSSRDVRRATVLLLTQRALGRTTLVARFGGLALTVVVAAELGMAVRTLRRTVQCHERELGDGEPRTQDDRDRVEVGDLERERATEAGVDKPRGGVDDEPETAEARFPLYTRDHVVRQLHRLGGPAQYELRRVDHEVAVLLDLQKLGQPGGWRAQVDRLDPVIVEDAEGPAQAQVHARRLHHLRVPGVDPYSPLVDQAPDRAVGENGVRHAGNPISNTCGTIVPLPWTWPCGPQARSRS